MGTLDIEVLVATPITAATAAINGINIALSPVTDTANAIGSGSSAGGFANAGPSDVLAASGCTGWQSSSYSNVNGTVIGVAPGNFSVPGSANYTGPGAQRNSSSTAGSPSPSPAVGVAPLSFGSSFMDRLSTTLSLPRNALVAGVDIVAAADPATHNITARSVAAVDTLAQAAAASGGDSGSGLSSGGAAAIAIIVTLAVLGGTTLAVLGTVGGASSANILTWNYPVLAKTVLTKVTAATNSLLGSSSVSSASTAAKTGAEVAKTASGMSSAGTGAGGTTAGASSAGSSAAIANAMAAAKEAVLLASAAGVTTAGSCSSALGGAAGAMRPALPSRAPRAARLLSAC